MPTPAERKAALEAELEALRQAEEADEQEYEYEIGRGDNYARVSSKSKAGKKISKFFKDAFDIDLEDELVQDEPADEPKDKPKPGRSQAKGGEVRAFQRRIG